MLASKERVRDNGMSDEIWFTTIVALDIPHWSKYRHKNFFYTFQLPDYTIRLKLNHCEILKFEVLLN